MLRRWTLVAMLAAAVLLFLNLGVTPHAIDQIRDFEVARQLAVEGKIPLESPRFSNAYTMPPGFYFFLAAPLLIKPTVQAGIAFFLLFHLIAIGLTAREIGRASPAAAAVFVAGAFPFFATLHIHSVWNNGLIIGFSALLLFTFLRFLRATDDDQAARCAAAGVIVFAFLVQISPSAVPLGLGLAAYVARIRGRALLRPPFLAALVGVVLLFVVWALVHPQPFLSTSAAKLAAGDALSLRAAFDSLFDAAKWRDAFLLPYYLFSDMFAEQALARIALAASFVLLGLGCALAAFLRITGRLERSGQAIFDIAAIWLVVAFSFLKFGVYYYTYAILPWLLALAGIGIAGFLQLVMRERQQAVATLLATIVFVGQLWPQAILYRSAREQGMLLMPVGDLVFPRLRETPTWLPFLPFTVQDELLAYLRDHGICASELRGAMFFLLNDLTWRQQVRECGPGEGARLYYLGWNGFRPSPAGPGDAAVNFSGGFWLARLDAEAGKQSTGSALGAPPPASTNVLSTEMETYALYRTAAIRLPYQLTMPRTPSGRLLVSVRCDEDVDLQSLRFVVLDNPRATLVHEIQSQRMLWKQYAEFLVDLPAGSAAADSVELVSTGSSVIRCDLSAA